MGMTMSQKILAFRAGLERVAPDELIEASLNMVLGNDITAPVAIEEFEKNAESVFDRDKISLVLDHFVPNKDIKAATQCKTVRKFASKHDITNFFDESEMGIEHVILPEKGLVGPGDLVIGADSHTCTYGALGAFSTGIGSTDMAYAMISGKAWFKVPGAIKIILTGKPQKNIGGKDVILHIIGQIGVDGALYKSMEFMGSGVKNLTIDDRFTICNMAIEVGAKNGIFPVDDVTLDYVNGRYKGEIKIFTPDTDAVYDGEMTVDLSSLEPVVACPSIPENVNAASTLWNVSLDQVVIGSCTNGRLSDLRIAADIIKGNKVAKGVRLLIIPGSRQVYLDALKEGLLEIFINAGAVISPPTCGPCLGGYMGILADGETALATTNRNFVGRMGHKNSKVYLSGPAVAAASAIAGYICSFN